MNLLKYFTPIDGFPDYYINRQGIVISRRVWHCNKYGEPKVLIPNHDRNGYLTVDLRNAPNKKYHKFVHQLVAAAFIPNPNGYLYVNHKDRNKENKKPYSCKYRLYVCKNDENPTNFWDKHYNHR